MRRLFPFLAQAFACCTFAPSFAHAGAWLMPKGETLLIQHITSFESTQYWDSQGVLQPQARYRKWEWQPYVEHGLTQRLTVGGTAYVQRATQAGSQNTGLADPEIFLRANLWNDGLNIVSIQPLVKFPSRFTHPNRTPRGGSKSTDMEMSLLYGRSLHLFGPRDYLDVRFGYRQRNQGLMGQYRTDIALGLSPAEPWLIIPAMRGVMASEAPEDTAYSQTGDLDYDLLKGEITLAYRWNDREWVHATYFEHLSGLQTGTGQGLSLGYAVRF